MIPASPLLFRIVATVRNHQLFRPGDTLVVAISGGADSTALLDLLLHLPGYHLKLIAAHLNHGLRGAESDGDAVFCQQLAARYDIAYETRHVDVRQLAKAQRQGLEDTGRQVRIDFLDEIGKKYAASAVALAHHGDDQAETVLMRLLRGSGLTGLSGIAYRNDRNYVRPLLDISRVDIELYLRERSLLWREDSSNSDTIYLRNRIRHQLLPLLETYNPAIRSCLAATASIISGDEALLDDLTDQAFAATCREGDHRISTDIDRLRALKPALRRRVLRHAFKQLTGTLDGLSLCHIDSLCAMIASDRPNTRLSLPQNVTAVRAYGSLLLACGAADAGAHDLELQITAPGSYPLPGGIITVAPADTSALSAESGSTCFNLDRTPFPWLVRTFRPGDRITPFGMSGRKKVKDIFIDRKIPAAQRKCVPLLFCGMDLLWIAGVCASELSRSRAGDTAMMRVTWQDSTAGPDQP